jgi:hypothetical protein
MYENPYHQSTPKMRGEMSFTSEKLKQLDSEIDFSRPSTHKKNVEYQKQFEQEIKTMKKVIKKRY